MLPSDVDGSETLLPAFIGSITNSEIPEDMMVDCVDGEIIGRIGTNMVMVFEQRKRRTTIYYFVSPIQFEIIIMSL